MANNTLIARFLGGVRISRGREPLSGFATQKSLGLFCYLLDSHPDPVPRERLMTLFWGESPEDQARYNLRFALWNIRRSARPDDEGPDPLLTTRTHCGLASDLTVDIDSREFARIAAASDFSDGVEIYRKALDNYRGNFLDGFTLRNMPEWEEWLALRRESLHQSFLNLSTGVGEYLLTTGDPTAAAETFIRLLSFDTANEAGHSGLIRAYADMGRTPAALRQFDIYADVLKKNYDVAPRADLIALRNALRDRTYAPTAPTAPSSITAVEPHDESDAASEPAPKSIPTPSPLLDRTERVPFVGRSRELAELDEIVAEVRAGHGTALIISGEMGIGKTRLFGELLKRTSDFFIGIGESQEIESLSPFEGLLQVFESFGTHPRLPAALKSELSELTALRFSTGEEVGQGARVTDRLRRWIVNLTQISPTLIALDDLHWGHDSLLSTFATLAQECRRRPLLLVGIFRTYEVQTESALGSSLVSLARTGRLRRIDLTSLSVDETSTLLRLLASEEVARLRPEEIERLCKFCEGIPLYAIELAGFLQQGMTDFIKSPRIEGLPEFAVEGERGLVPPLMLKIAELRLKALDPEAQELVRTASLLIGEFSLRLLERLVPLEQERLEDILVDLEHRNILQHIEKARGLTFHFGHQMLRLGIAELIPAIEKRRIYDRIADRLTTLSDEAPAESLAYYLYNAGRRAESVPHLLAGARLWFKAGDATTGTSYSRIAYNTALELFDEYPELLTPAVQVHVDHLQRQGNVKFAIDVLNAAYEKIQQGKLIQGRSDILAKREELKKLLGREPDRVKRDMPLLALVATRRALAAVKLTQGDPQAAESILDQAEKILDLLNSPPAIRETGMIFLVRSRLLLYQGNPGEAVWMAESALELLKRYGSEGDAEAATAALEEARSRKSVSQ
ncbi:MAG: hypothetical protein FJY67_04460 [Calditrichaeota bacterium]|nr:hypothetical protein [Calditrichota bacterium]